MRENILPELSNFYCHPGKAGGSPRAFRFIACSYSTPEPPQDHPEQFLRSGKSRLWTPPFQDTELLPQRQVFQEQKVEGTGRSNDQDGEKHQRTRMSQFYMAPHKAQRAAHLFDLAPDPCFGEPQRLAQQFSQTRRWLRAQGHFLY